MQQLSPATNSRNPVDLEPRDAEVCAEKLVDVLPGVMWFIRRNMRRNRLKGLSVPAFRTLVLLSRNPAATLSEVSEFLGASMPTSSRIVSCLVSKRLISRKVAAGDRRQVALQLTAAGKNVLDSALTGTRRAVANELADLSADERLRVSQAMDVLRDAFRTATYPLDCDAGSDAGGEVCEPATLNDIAE